MTKKIGVQIERVITRCTVRGDELFVSKVFLEKKLIFLEPSVRRPNAAHYSPNETHYSVSRSMAQPQTVFGRHPKNWPRSALGIV